MAQLKFDGIQPVTFGGRDCMPKTNTEQRLRLQGLKFATDADNQKSNEILADCFPNDKEYVQEFLQTQMTPFEKNELRAYLITGPRGIRLIDESVANAINKGIEEANNA